MSRFLIGMALTVAAVAVLACSPVAENEPSSATVPLATTTSTVLTPIGSVGTSVSDPTPTPSPTTAPSAPSVITEVIRPTERADAALRTPLTVPELVQQTRASVVHISTESMAIDSFGRAIPGGGVGTGFIIDASGLIVTNNHVVEGAQRILVDLFDGQVFDADVVGRDPQTDLAVLRIEAPGLSVVSLGRSSELDVGESVVAMGHALDLPGGATVTLGVVSAVDRTITNIGPQRLTLSDLIQTDASINPGNSGGPLLNLFGEVVGINSAGASDSQGIGFAIAIDSAKPVIDTLIVDGHVTRGFLGVTSGTITRSIARQNDLPVDEGIYVFEVSEGSPAEDAGIRPDDIIVAINDLPVTDSGALSRILAQYEPGIVVEVSVVRGDVAEPRRVSVTLGTRPE